MSDILLQAMDRMSKSKVHLKYLKYFYDKAELINADGLNNNANYISSGPYTEDDIHTILSMFSSKLTLEDKIAIKMFKTENLIILEVK